ncbi:MAG: histidine--tRNA ligase [Gammaproteobacteria bacterium]|nr:MAG: histidine--tRNA ligase [Gammaproteobacteria bacterium]
MNDRGVVSSVRGMHDILPDDSFLWQDVEVQMQNIFNQYGYKQIRTPLLESSKLFNHSIGEITDIVSKEMYSFNDRSGESLSLRPEGTASTVRCVIQHSLTYKKIQKLWYNGTMYRYERPQKGRYRQFHQAGCEVFGLISPAVEAELILLVNRLWQKLSIDSDIELEINSLGDNNTRISHKKELLDYFNNNLSSLDEDSKKRLHTNPLRILDTKNPAMAELIKNAPNILDFLDDESKLNFNLFKDILQKNNVAYKINQNLVRGLDYYNRTVFEFKTTKLGSSDTICGGGRYDGLVEILGGDKTPACGFAIGIERVIELIINRKKQIKKQKTDVYLIIKGDNVLPYANSISESIHNSNLNLIVVQNMTNNSIKSQFKQADKSGAKLAIILGDDELSKNIVAIKFLKESEKPQQNVAMSDLTLFIKEQFYD